VAATTYLHFVPSCETAGAVSPSSSCPCKGTSLVDLYLYLFFFFKLSTLCNNVDDLKPSNANVRISPFTRQTIVTFLICLYILPQRYINFTVITYSLPYNGYRFFPGGKQRPRRDADPSPPSSAVVIKV